MQRSLGERFIRYDLYPPALPSTTAAHAPHSLGAAQSLSWSCPSAHGRPPGPGHKYPAPGQHAAKSAAAATAMEAMTAAAGGDDNGGGGR